MQFKVLRLFLELETKLNITHYLLLIIIAYVRKTENFRYLMEKMGTLCK